MTIALEMEGVTRRFGNRTALEDVTLRVPAGRSVRLTGANGAGKTTLLAVAAGVLAADSGTVSVFGRRPGNSDDTARLIGYMADAPLVYEALSARENLMFYGRLYGLHAPDGRIGELLDLVGLADRAGDPVTAYSAGMQRRLDLARAVLHEPRLLLMDEPANSLDADGIDILTGLLATYRAGDRAVLFTSHSVQAGDDWADETLVIERGRLQTPAQAEPRGNEETRH